MTKEQGKPVIECDRVSKSFRIFDGKSLWNLLWHAHTFENMNALTDVSFKIPKGQILGILGRNGSGKSTLLRTIGGIYHPSSGVVHVNGDLSAIYELGVTGNDLLSGRRFAERWLSFFYGLSGSKSKSTLDWVKEFSELSSKFDEPIYKYSSGMKSRLYFSVATAIPGKLYLIDEVLSVGDEYFQAKCWRRLRELFGQGASGILATHDWSGIIKVCQTACILDKGKLQFMGPAMQMVQKYLSLEAPNSHMASFAESLPECFDVHNQNMCEIKIPILIQGPCKLRLAYSVEQGGMGADWEHLLHQSFIDLPKRHIGLHEAMIRIPDLPLPAGEFMLNLFLMAQADNHSDFVHADVRSWTYGNHLSLKVQGKQTAAKTLLPIALLE